MNYWAGVIELKGTWAAKMLHGRPDTRLVVGSTKPGLMQQMVDDIGVGHVYQWGSLYTVTWTGKNLKKVLDKLEPDFKFRTKQVQALQELLTYMADNRPSERDPEFVEHYVRSIQATDPFKNHLSGNLADGEARE